MSQCAGITAAGQRCKGQAISKSQYCFSHSPDHAEARKQRASRGGKRGGRGRPQQELSDVKDRLKGLANGVLLGKIDRADAAVVGQLYNTLIRAVGVELKAREQLELIERLERLEDAAAAQKGAGRWGA